MANNYAVFRVTRCCNSGETGFFSVNGNLPGLIPPAPGQGVFLYGAASDITLTDANGNVVIFEVGQCYTFETTSQSTGFTFVVDLNAADFTSVTDCQDNRCGTPCSTEPKKLVFTPCCEQYPTLEFQGTDWQDYIGVIIPLGFNKQPANGQFQQIGIGFNNITYNQLQFGNCYDVTVVDITQAEFDSLNTLPPYIEGTSFTQVTDSTSGLDCTSDQVILACPECAQACYRVIDCEGNFFQVLSDITAYGLDDISNYVGQFVTLIDNSLGTPITGTFFVDSLSPTCTNAVGNITVDPVLPAECDCRCFEIVGTVFNVNYVDCENNLISNKLGGSFKFCSKTYPIVSTAPGDTFEIIEGSNCVDGECQIECFQLVNCETEEILYTESELYPYFISNQIITINGYDGCWQVLDGTGECEDCPTNLIVLTVFDDCPSCVGPVAYKLTSCSNSADIIYTTDDLSAYIDKTVELENCGCYLVELIDYNPPTDTSVTVLYPFDDCEACEAIYYELTDCVTPSTKVYTTVDLSIYVGKVIKIKNCDNCWEVDTTREPGVLETVTFDSEYLGCLECLVADLKCNCTKITNVNDTLSLNVKYYDCDDILKSVLLAPGETTGKICLKLIASTIDPQVGFVETFGECQEGVCPPENLVTSQNRKIKPGYNTPICSADKYDKITCEFADIYYKKALEGRYGISNCCPEKLQNWTLKKNLIDMQALKDPYFNCSPKTSCNCGNTSICTTCNSKN